MRFSISCLAAILLVSASQVRADVDVFTCEPEWAALVAEIGGDHVDVYSATTAFQDPHFIQARPSLISRVRRADLLVCTGAELEQGWLPLLLSRSGNPAVQPGTDGALFMADQLDLASRPTELDRGHGHVHAAGNPHVHTDPNKMLTVAAALLDRLQRVDPDNSVSYQSAHDAFVENMQVSIARWEQEAVSLKGKKLITHHQYWRYLIDWLGMEDIAYLEPLPGVQPSVAHLSSLMDTHAREAEMIVRVNYSSARGADLLSDKTGLPVRVLPSTVDYQGGQRLSEWYEQVIEILQ